ncbi:hypothetical protein ETTORE_0376 [Pseudomonas phage Ettore]|nr:hypothetical protein ETTORE_0376 [Pseudomonas phage Ettore]
MTCANANKINLHLQLGHKRKGAVAPFSYCLDNFIVSTATSRSSFIERQRPVCAQTTLRPLTYSIMGRAS